MTREVATIGAKVLRWKSCLRMVSTASMHRGPVAWTYLLGRGLSQAEAVAQKRSSKHKHPDSRAPCCNMPLENIGKAMRKHTISMSDQYLEGHERMKEKDCSRIVRRVEDALDRECVCGRARRTLVRASASGSRAKGTERAKKRGREKAGSSHRIAGFKSQISPKTVFLQSNH